MNQVSTVLLAFIIVLSGLTIVGVQNASAVTWVEGHISVDTTWTVADTPYIVSNDVYVDEGATLTIEPGVEIRFGGIFNIFVDGNLSAIGTSDDEIIFTSNKLTPAPGDWNTIKLNGTADSSLYIEHCLIEYGVHGVTIDSIGSGEVMGCEFVNNSESGVHVVGESNSMMEGNAMKLNNYGISTEGNYVSGFSIVNNEIVNNTQGGVYVYSHAYYWYDDAYLYNVTISNNTISSNGGTGVYVYSEGGHADTVYLYNVTISNNTVSSNSRTGIYVYVYYYGHSDGAYLYNVTISNNTISLNSGNGVYVYSYAYYSSYDAHLYNVTISNNTVSSNGEVGVKTQGEHLVGFDVVMLTNVVSANNQGIVVSSGNKANITSNSISYNTQHGVLFDGSTGNAAHFNDIYQNRYGMNVTGGATGGATVDAESCYWGDSSGPYHISMNPWGLGNPVNGDGIDLDFIPPLTSPLAMSTSDRFHILPRIRQPLE